MKALRLVVLLLATSLPVLAWADGVPREAEARPSPAGVFTGAALGGLVAGPPGAFAGVVLASIATHWKFIDRRAELAEQQAGELASELDSLRSERRSMNARIAALQQALEAERDHAAEIEVLAHGLGFSLGFRTGSADPPEDVSDGLLALAQLVTAVPSLEVHVSGYADPRGSRARNLELSAARAEAVRERLVAAGVPPHRIHATAHGAGLAADEALPGDPDDWALQRRVEVRLESRQGSLALQQ